MGCAGSSTGQRRSEDGRAGAKILIVEDDATIARFVELELTHLGHEVYKVADGDLAVAEIERVEPDLVLLDLMLPGTDGLTIARTVRERTGCRCRF